MIRTATLLVTALLIPVAVLTLAGSPAAQQAGEDVHNILTLRERAELMQKWWEWRRENVIPEILREQGVDMWIVRDDEGELFFNNESPVYVSLLPANYEGMTLASQHVRPGSQRTPWFLVFFDDGDEVEYIEPHTYDDITALVEDRDERVAFVVPVDDEPVTVEGRRAALAVLAPRPHDPELLGPDDLSIPVQTVETAGAKTRVDALSIGDRRGRRVRIGPVTALVGDGLGGLVLLEFLRGHHHIGAHLHLLTGVGDLDQEGGVLFVVARDRGGFRVPGGKALMAATYGRAVGELETLWRASIGAPK